jgi:hypothetical protein
MPNPKAPRDPLAGKRQLLAEAMNLRLVTAYYSAEMPEIARMPEFHLDSLLTYYGADSRYVY